MATPIDQLTDDAAKLSVKDDTESVISLCCWNINGSATASIRKEVCTETFKRSIDPYTSSPLIESDIICVQEVPVDCYGPNIGEYIPIGNSYRVAERCRERGSRIENAVFYNKEKFTLVVLDCLDKAYDWMEKKKQIYHKINRGGDVKKDKAIKGTLEIEGDSPKICAEVLEECKECKRAGDFEANLARYRFPTDSSLADLKSPKELLESRMAIALLEIKSTKSKLMVISIHSYSNRSGSGAAQRLAYLLFDFIEAMRKTNQHFPVIIAGDFNCDIHGDRSLAGFLRNYQAPVYPLRPLRGTKPRIDFVIVSRGSSDYPLELIMTDVTPHDLIVSQDIHSELGGEQNYEKITCHNPLSAKLVLKKVQTKYVPASLSTVMRREV